MKRGHFSARWHSLAIALVAAALLLASPFGAVAQEGEDEGNPPEAGLNEGSDVAQPPVSGFVALPGECESDVVPFVVGLGVDCEFDLLDGFEPAEIQSASLWDGTSDVPCTIEGRRLRCVDVGTLLTQPGDWSLELRLNDEAVPGAASITNVAPPDEQIRIALDPEMPVIFEGRALDLFSRASDEIEETFLTIRVRGSSRVVETLPFEPGSFDQGRLNRFTIDLPPGQYRVWPCVGASAATCVELPGGALVQVLDPTLMELIPGHNRRSGQRINIVFTGAGIGGVETLTEIATLTLGLGGPIAVDNLGQPTDDPERIQGLHFGPMAIEPLRSNTDKFNFWVLPDDLNSDLALVAGSASRNDLDALGLPNVHVTTFYDGSATGGTSDARASSYFGNEIVPRRSDIDFGGARVSVDPDAPVLSSETLAHEWGHAIFELRDEYFGFDGRPVLTAYPNCAPDLETAADWWAPLLGDVDPFVDEVIRARTEVGLVEDGDAAYADLADAVMVQPIVGGCYGNIGEADAVRPSVDSLMNTEIPVFGMVNRRRVETVLRRFEVGGPLIDVADVGEVDCLARSDRLTCEGSLATDVAAPDATTLFVEGAPCLFDRSTEPVTFSCFASDSGDQAAVLTFEDQTLDVAIERPPEPAEPPSTTTTSTTQPPLETSPTSSTIDESPQNPADERAATASDGPDGRTPSWRFPIALGLTVAGLSVASVALKRRSDAKGP